MQLVILRHADAGNPLKFASTGKPDAFRPLSPKGHKRMRGAVEGLMRLVPTCNLIATSPYTRAKETADIVAEAYGIKDVQTTSVLEPNASIEAFLAWIRSHIDNRVVIVVGHEPHLGELATALNDDAGAEPIQLKKSGACLFEFDGIVEEKAGTLLWHMGPKKLAKAGDD